MDNRQLRRTAFGALLWMVLILTVTTSATYAWFSFNNATNITPIASSIGDGKTNLLISNSSTGGFDTSCQLVTEGQVPELFPVSTGDLKQFYVPKAQNSEGISTLYRDVTEELNSRAIHGTVYLKAEHGTCDVYLDRGSLFFGENPQALAALRFAMQITVGTNTERYIFPLDSMGNTAKAEEKLTVPTAGTVVSTIDNLGSPSYMEDPGKELSDYFAKSNSTDSSLPLPGNSSLCTLKDGEVATVEYWVYLEGCDPNCINSVQGSDLNLQLGFAGVEVQTEG